VEGEDEILRLASFENETQPTQPYIFTETCASRKLGFVCIQQFLVQCLSQSLSRGLSRGGQSISLLTAEWFFWTRHFNKPRIHGRAIPRFCRLATGRPSLVGRRRWRSWPR